MSDESESETDSSLADDESNGQIRRRSSTTSRKRRWLKEEVTMYRYYLIYIIKGVMFVCLSVCIYVPYGRPNGWADRDQT